MRKTWGIRVACGLLAAACAACSSSASSSPPGIEGAGGGDGATTHPDQAPLPGQTECTVVEKANIPEPDFEHLDICTPITYATPPSGGDHWPIWSTYTEHKEAVPREMYVHNLEHGAIVFAYGCDGCDDVLAAYRAQIALVGDPLCLTMVGPTSRTLITPDPLLETPIALSAWGATYTATCIDPPSMQAFVTAHYGNGREPLCYEGYPEPDCN